MKCQNDVVKLAVEKRTKRSLSMREKKFKTNQMIQIDRLPVIELEVVATAVVEPLSRRAICFFFRNYVYDNMRWRNTACRGFVEHLLPLYSQAKVGSALHLATEAVALCLFGAWHAEIRDAENEAANETFGRALVATQNAIFDPVENTTDETLITVLMLGFYEVRSMSFRS
jgi:hypothetical protein